MQISQSKLMFKWVLFGGGVVCIFITWLLLSSSYQHLNTEKRLNHLHNLFHNVQYSKAAMTNSQDGLSAYTKALRQFRAALIENPSLLAFDEAFVVQLEAQIALLESLDNDTWFDNKDVLRQHNALLLAFSTVAADNLEAAWQDDYKWWLLLLVAMTLWGALLYCLHKKLTHSIELTEQVLHKVISSHSYKIPEHFYGHLAAESQLIELLDFVDVLSTRLDEVHSRFIEEAQEATLGSMTQGFSKSLLQIIEHAATHQKRLTTIVNKLANGQNSEEQEAQLHNKSRQILGQLDVELANVYDLLADFEQISNFHQFDIEVEFNLKELVEAVFARHSQALVQEQFHVSYEIPDNLQLQSAPAVFEQIYHHCISNSVKHAKCGDKVLHIVVSAMVVNDYLHLYFKDDGAGIDSELLPILAEPTLNSRQNFGKHGLGLSVIHHLVTDKLNGEFKIQSPAHGGACIHIVLENTRFELASPCRKTKMHKQDLSNSP
ncbi:HAMP domain-containing sensor histidine kinase [Pseudoalteromonas sp. S16_S37]|uniref:HAMP domain-containing sensor histidine kinase n=1 Tax=Pseudoalteromonas sp. S16_S37 TaxID=2720228 RepID=UPI001681294D|nr:HAMP domain-containing sensor histidine kinase [Pseudoalteromonas sp. S16_S37]MBD1580910.1 HAMP domain-containing histidine kinase [Pseudoalteromonas sp. S16_S37]